jgi:hypothetical protein
MIREISSRSTLDRQIWKLREMTQTEERILEPDIIVIIQAAKPKPAGGRADNGPIVSQISNE